MKTINLFILLFINSLTIGFSQNQDSKPMLLGCIERSSFNEKPFSDWFNEGYNLYQLDSATLMSIPKDSLTNLNITLVFGSWCPDSQAEVPIFFKICDFLNIPQENIKIIGVDRTKDIDPICSETEMIEFVPTYFFYIHGKLVKKIVEHPEDTFEAIFSSLFKNI